MTSSIPRPCISACIIAFNEADRIQDCLDSLAFCDEIMLVDSFSSDTTVAIARAAGARVLQRHFAGFRSQKAFCVAQATYDWVLCLDADERISDTLRRSIEQVRNQGFGDAAGYRSARISYYFGRFLRYGDAYPDHGVRLFDRRVGGWRSAREIHEKITIDGPVHTLTGDVLHYPYRHFMQLLDKKQNYARMMAEYEFSQGKRATLAKLITAPLWRFMRGWLLRGGFRDGWPGLINSIVNSNYVAQKTMMLWLLNNNQALVAPEQSPLKNHAQAATSQ